MATGANPVLKHLHQFLIVTSQVTLYTVPAGRALVISKVSIAHVNLGSPVGTISLSIGGDGVVQNVPLGAAEQWTETGLTALAGETIQVQVSVGSSYGIHVFGEEVDN